LASSSRSLRYNVTSYPVDVGKGYWKKGFISKPGPLLTVRAVEIRNILFPAKVASGFSWTDDHTLLLKLRYNESPHTEAFTYTFNGNNLTLDEQKSFKPGKKTIMRVR